MLQKFGESRGGRRVAEVLSVILECGEGAIRQEVKNISGAFPDGGRLGAKGGLEILRGAEAGEVLRVVEHEDGAPFWDGDAGGELAAG